MNKLLLENVADKIELNFIGYHVKGVAILNTLDNIIGGIQMKPFDIDATNLKDEAELHEIIKSLMNDNGFGCKRILGAFIVLYANYSNTEVYSGTKIHLKNFYLNKDVDETPEKYIKQAEEVWFKTI